MKPLNFDIIISRRYDEPKMPEMTSAEKIEYEKHKNDWIYAYARLTQIKDRDKKIQKIKDNLKKYEYQTI